MVVEAAHHLQAGQHAVDTVEAAAFRLGVEVTADHHRRGVLIRTGTPGEQVADGVHAQGQPGGLAPVAEQLATGVVFGAQRQAATAAARGRADFGHGHQAGP